MAGRNTGDTKNRPKVEATEKPKRLSGAPINRLRLVRQMIRQYTDQLSVKDGPKSGVGELIRLIALERELAGETENVREIKVTWVEPKPAEPLNAG